MVTSLSQSDARANAWSNSVRAPALIPRPSRLAMCSACGFPAAPGHWTDAGAQGPGDRLRLRFLRLTAVNRLLAPYRLTAYDASYLELAIRHGLPLATRDAALRAAASSCGVPLSI